MVERWTGRRHHAGGGLLAAACVVALVASGCALLPTEKVSLGDTAITLPPAPPPPLVSVTTGNVTLSAQIAGNVTSTKVQNLYFDVSGRVTQLNVQNGQAVKAGQVLATLEIASLQYQITDAQLAIQRDQMNISEHQQTALAQPPTNQDQASQLALQQQQDQLALQQDQSNLGQLQLQLDQNEVIAPFSGVVNDVAITTGDEVSAYQVVMDISDPSHQAFIANLDATTAQELASGDAFTMNMTAQKGQTYHGTINSIVIPTPDEIAAAEQSGNPNGIPQPQCTLTVTDLKGTPPLDAAFTAIIDIQSAKNVLKLPTDAVHQFNGGAYVDVYKGGVISEVPVTVGLQGDTSTEIQSGVSAGEQVVEP